MCGISGILNMDGGPAPCGVVELMAEALRHRGPDDEGYFTEGPVALGFRRLSIIDLSGGHQPMANEDDSVHVVFNGEIYNFQELRRQLELAGHRFRTDSDTEVIVHGYEEWGEDMVIRLNGMFAFAVWDAGRMKLLLARDRIGVKPLYYCMTDGGLLAFASELKSLSHAPGFCPEVSDRAVFDFFSYLYVPGPESIYRGVFKLQPGHLLAVEDGRVVMKAYWEPRIEVGPERSMEDWGEELRCCLEDSVRRQMVADVPLGVWLSGGIDSSAVTAAMARADSRDIRSFNVGFDVPGYDETAHALRVSRHVGTTHETFKVGASSTDLLPKLLWYLDEPTADATIIPTYLLSERTRRKVKVVLSGEGGDELFAGYHYHRGMQLNRLLRFLPHSLRLILARATGELPHFGSPRLGRGLHRIERVWQSSLAPPFEDYLHKSSLFTPEEQARLFSGDFRQRSDGFEHLKALRMPSRLHPELDPTALTGLSDLTVYLPGDLLTKVDRMSMACSLEARVPFLDNEVLDLALRIPSRLKVRGLRTKHVLREALKPWLPSDVLDRGKQAFNPPLEYWLQHNLIEYARSHGMFESLADSGYFDPAYVHVLAHEHLSGRRDHARKLWALLVFAVWWRRVRGAREIPS